MKKVWRALGLVVGLAALAVVLVHLYFAAMITWWRDHPPRETSFMAERMRELERKNPGAPLRYQFVSYERIAVSLKRAMIAAEDSKFVEHEGFDWDGIELAIEKNQKRGRIVAGGSTITQQLAKNLFLSGSRSWLRKGEEAIITLMLEAILDKRRIFELYLNVIEWGDGVYGAEAASRTYFNKNASNLTREEAAYLAAMIPSPLNVFNPQKNPKRLKRRQRVILKYMNSMKLDYSVQ